MSVPSPAIRASYGFFLLAWNTYEEVLELGIWKLTSMSAEDTHIILGALMTQAKTNILQSLASAKLSSEDASDIIDIIKAIHESGNRTVLVHGHSSIENGQVRFGLREVKKKLRYKEKLMDGVEFARHNANLAAEIQSLQEALGVQDSDFTEYRNALANLDSNAPKFPVPPISNNS